jgi:hypothetical protein
MWDVNGRPAFQIGGAVLWYNLCMISSTALLPPGFKMDRIGGKPSSVPEAPCEPSARKKRGMKRHMPSVPP